MRIFNPDVSFVQHILLSINIEDACGCVDTLADILTDSFEPYNIIFEKEIHPFYGTKQFRSKTAARVGIPGAELSGTDVIVFITRTTANLKCVTQEMIDHVQDLVKHELIHLEQAKVSKTGGIGNSEEGDAYFADPQEIAAIASEMESQLLRIQPDRHKLIGMIQVRDRSLVKSDRYKLYLESLKEDPVGFRKAFNKMMASVIARLNTRRTI